MTDTTDIDQQLAALYDEHNKIMRRIDALVRLKLADTAILPSEWMGTTEATHKTRWTRHELYALKKDNPSVWRIIETESNGKKNTKHEWRRDFIETLPKR